VAVQTQLEPFHYRSKPAFQSRVMALMEAATEGLPKGQPRVIAFPEAFALPLVFWLETPEKILQARSTLQAALGLLRQDWWETLRLGIFSPRVLYHLRAPKVWPVYQETFAEAARATGSYVVAGSLFSPLMDWEPATQLHRESNKVYNLSLVISPQGRVLGRVSKLNLTQSERASFLSQGEIGGQVVHSRIGTLANLICLDAFHDHLIEYADAAGAWLVVQPSANAAKWNGPWSNDPSQLEGQVWLREGLAKKLQGRENLRYGLNPMLNGKFYELEFEGRSGIYTAGKPLVLAKESSGDEIIHLGVDPDGS